MMILPSILSHARVLDISIGCNDMRGFCQESKIDSTWIPSRIKVNMPSVLLYVFFFFHFLGYAWVTLATNDAYSLGALVLAHSLRRVGTKYELACLVTPGVTAAMRYRSYPSSIVHYQNVI